MLLLSLHAVSHWWQWGFNGSENKGVGAKCTGTYIILTQYNYTTEPESCVYLR